MKSKTAITCSIVCSIVVGFLIFAANRVDGMSSGVAILFLAAIVGWIIAAGLFVEISIAEGNSERTK